jgi:hypothetical protein
MPAHGVPNYPNATYKGGRPTEEPLSNFGINTQVAGLPWCGQNVWGRVTTTPPAEPVRTIKV